MQQHILELTDKHQPNHQFTDLRCFSNEHTRKINPFDCIPEKTKKYNDHCPHCNEICAAHTKSTIEVDKSEQTFTLTDILSPHTISFIHSSIPSAVLYNIVVYCEKNSTQRDQQMNAAVLCLELSKRSDVSNKRQAYVSKFNTILEKLSTLEIQDILKRLATWYNTCAKGEFKDGKPMGTVGSILDTYAFHFEIFHKTYSQRPNDITWSNDILAHGILNRLGTTKEEIAKEIAKRSGEIQKDVYTSKVFNELDELFGDDEWVNEADLDALLNNV